MDADRLNTLIGGLDAHLIYDDLNRSSLFTLGTSFLANYLKGQPRQPLRP